MFLDDYDINFGGESDKESSFFSYVLRVMYIVRNDVLLHEIAFWNNHILLSTLSVESPPLVS